MDKGIFIERIKQEIENGQIILDDLKSLQKYSNNRRGGLSYYDSRLTPKYNREEREKITSKLTLWERRVYDILKNYFGDRQSSPLKEFNLSETNKWFDFKEIGIHCMNANLTTLHSYLDRIFIKANI